MYYQKFFLENQNKKMLKFVFIKYVCILIILNLNTTLNISNNLNFLHKLENKNIMIDLEKTLKINSKIEENKNFNIYNIYILMFIPESSNCQYIVFDVYDNTNTTLLISNVIIEYNYFPDRGYLKFDTKNSNKKFKNFFYIKTNPVMLFTKLVIIK